MMETVPVCQSNKKFSFDVFKEEQITKEVIDVNEQNSYPDTTRSIMAAWFCT